MTYRNVILLGDVREKLRELPAESVHCVVTSPPYWGLRSYDACACVNEGRLEVYEDGRGDRHTAGGAIAFHRRQPDSDCPKCQGSGRDKSLTSVQLGLEATPEEYVATMVDVFREVRRVLRKDGTCWVNLGDSYAGSNASQGGDGSASGLLRDGRNESSRIATAQGTQRYITAQTTHTKDAPGLKPKDLCGIPWRVALALQADGWWLRSDCIWAKPNPMPESVTDRPTKSHEYIFLLTKSGRYFYDAEAVREDGPTYTRKAGGYYGRDGNNASRFGGTGGFGDSDVTTTGRNARTVWTIATESFNEAHFATYPTELVKRCIQAGTSEHGCCSTCGAPWRRVVERLETTGRTASNGFGNGELSGNTRFGDSNVRTTGWQPSCRCCMMCGEVPTHAAQRPRRSKGLAPPVGEDPETAGAARSCAEPLAAHMPALQPAVHRAQNSGVLQQDLHSQMDVGERQREQVYQCGWGDVPLALATDSSDGRQVGENPRTPPIDVGTPGPPSNEKRAGASHQREQKRQQDRKPDSNDGLGTQPTPHEISFGHPLTPAPVQPCVVLDPFMGSGTTLLVARRQHRNGIGIELNPEYVEMAKRRLSEKALPMFDTLEVKE